jgi:hypothetical protein
MKASGGSWWLSWAASALVASAVGVLSASKLIKLARAAGWSAQVAPLVFLAIDGAGVAGGLTAFYGASRAARNYGWFVLCESTTLSLLGNEAADWVQAHGALPGWMTAVVAAAVPLQLPLTVHQTMLLAHRDHPATDVDRSMIDPIAATDPTTIPLDQAANRAGEAIEAGRHAADRIGTAGRPIPTTPTGPTATPPQPPPADSRSIDPLDSIDRPADQHISFPLGSSLDQSYPIEDTRSIRPSPVRSIEELRRDLAHAIGSGALDPRPTAEAIRKHLSISPSRARLLRDEFADPDRPELHVVPIDPDDEATG